MPDLEKVIKWLEHCGSADMCDKCPYLVKDIENEGDGCQMFADALALLKAQEPRVMTADEMIEAVKTNEAVYVEESPEGSSQHCFWGLVVEGCDPPQDGGYNYPGGVFFNVINAHEDMWDGDFYGLNSPLGWRCWTSRPTDEQRKAVKWDA